MVTRAPLIVATEVSLLVKLQAPFEAEVGGVIVKKALP
jgi:hypothetical protein